MDNEMVEWVKTASADEIVDQLIDKLNFAPPKLMEQVLNVFLNRAKAQPGGNMGNAYEAFTSDREIAPHDCVHESTKRLDNDSYVIDPACQGLVWKLAFGRKVWRENYERLNRGKKIKKYTKAEREEFRNGKAD